MAKPESKMMVQNSERGESRTHEDFGANSTMGQIAKVMEPNAFGILIDLVSWAKLWDQIYLTADTKKVIVDWDDSTIKVMMSPFIGFGNNPRLWGVVAAKVTALIGRELPLWLGDPAYRKSHSMVWCVLQSIAPSLASDGGGFEAQQQVVQILADGFKPHD